MLKLIHRISYNFALFSKMILVIKNCYIDIKVNLRDICTLFSIFIDVQMKHFKEDTNSMINHISNDIVNKEKSTIDEFTKNLDNSVSCI